MPLPPFQEPTQPPPCDGRMFGKIHQLANDIMGEVITIFQSFLTSKAGPARKQLTVNEVAANTPPCLLICLCLFCSFYNAFLPILDRRSIVPSYLHFLEPISLVGNNLHAITCKQHLWNKATFIRMSF